MGLYRYLFGPKITYVIEWLPAQDVQGEQSDMDFPTCRRLKRFIVESLDNYACPSCGAKRIGGSGMIVRCGKVHLYQQVATKGWLGGTKYKDRFVKTMWRLHESGLRNAPGRALLNLFGTLDDPPGELKCNARGCTWTAAGERGGTISLGDLLKG